MDFLQILTTFPHFPLILSEFLDPFQLYSITLTNKIVSKAFAPYIKRCLAYFFGYSNTYSPLRPRNPLARTKIHLNYTRWPPQQSFPRIIQTINPRHLFRLKWKQDLYLSQSIDDPEYQCACQNEKSKPQSRSCLRCLCSSETDEADYCITCHHHHNYFCCIYCQKLIYCSIGCMKSDWWRHQIDCAIGYLQETRKLDSKTIELDMDHDENDLVYWRTLLARELVFLVAKTFASQQGSKSCIRFELHPNYSMPVPDCFLDYCFNSYALISTYKGPSPVFYKRLAYALSTQKLIDSALPLILFHKNPRFLIELIDSGKLPSDAIYHKRICSRPFPTLFKRELSPRWSLFLEAQWTEQKRGKVHPSLLPYLKDSQGIVGVSRKTWIYTGDKRDTFFRCSRCLGNIQPLLHPEKSVRSSVLQQLIQSKWISWNKIPVVIATIIIVNKEAHQNWMQLLKSLNLSQHQEAAIKKFLSEHR